MRRVSKPHVEPPCSATSVCMQGFDGRGRLKHESRVKLGVTIRHYAVRILGLVAEISRHHGK
jgi:hypothetical protein